MLLYNVGGYIMIITDTYKWSDVMNYMLKKPMKAYVNISGKRRLGVIKKLNMHTIWVKVMDGAKTSYTIKRHVNKHKVRFV
jgi:hypothetical protein